eukprot:2273688-Pyramimonas_sp.AAC.1
MSAAAPTANPVQNEQELLLGIVSILSARISIAPMLCSEGAQLPPGPFAPDRWRGPVNRVGDPADVDAIALHARAHHHHLSSQGHETLGRGERGGRCQSVGTSSVRSAGQAGKWAVGGGRWE